MYRQRNNLRNFIRSRIATWIASGEQTGSLVHSKLTAKHTSQRERGQMVIILALASIAMGAAAGLATDVVIVFLNRTDLAR